MEKDELKDDVIKEELVDDTKQKTGEKKNAKQEWDVSRFEFALFINDFLICKRSFSISGFVEQSMQTLEFKDEVDKIVELIDEDLKSKSRIYTWYHATFDNPEWEPEMFTEPLINEGEMVLKFVVYDNGNEIISKQWDARYYPSYVRKCIDLTNRQVKIMKDDRATIYDKDKFFADHGPQLSGDLYVLMHMLSDKENLVPMIQKCIYEVCSSYDGYYEKVSDYHTVVEYKNSVVKRDKDGNVVYKQKMNVLNDGTEVGAVDALGRPWMVPVTEKVPGSKKYNFNIAQENLKLCSEWGNAVIEKTRKYANEFYQVSPVEVKNVRRSNKKSVE